MIQSSPRTWGCFQRRNHHPDDRAVFPTHVGVFLPVSLHRRAKESLPHARGGVSIKGVCKTDPHRSSPRTWGCFRRAVIMSHYLYVFPTHVGVFLPPSRPGAMRCCLPHARGGVSEEVTCALIGTESSPRTWGCFSLTGCLLFLDRVFPTHVGVFLDFSTACRVRICLPHARGGVSSWFRRLRRRRQSSPRTWGCFLLDGDFCTD